MLSDGNTIRRGRQRARVAVFGQPLFQSLHTVAHLRDPFVSLR
jgi:hypothetical protein